MFRYFEPGRSFYLPIAVQLWISHEAEAIRGSRTASVRVQIRFSFCFSARLRGVQTFRSFARGQAVRRAAREGGGREFRVSCELQPLFFSGASTTLRGPFSSSVTGPPGAPLSLSGARLDFLPKSGSRIPHDNTRRD